MNTGLVLNPQATDDQDAARYASELLEQTRRARDVGFDAVTTGHHYVTEYQQIQSVPLLSRAAADAGSMTVTVMVILPLHHPIAVAENIATLDLFTDRTVLVALAGYRDAEFDNFGIPKSERAGRLRESVEVIRKLWRETGVTYDGEHYSIEDVTINPRPEGGVPIWIGANRGPAVERAARIGDAWLANTTVRVEDLRDEKDRYDGIRRAAGDDTAIPVIRETIVASDRERAMELGKEYVLPKYRTYIEWKQDEEMTSGDTFDRQLERLAEDRFLLGTPAEIRDQIDDLVGEIEINDLYFHLQWPGQPHEQALRSIELLGDEVLPSV